MFSSVVHLSKIWQNYSKFPFQKKNFFGEITFINKIKSSLDQTLYFYNLHTDKDRMIVRKVQKDTFPYFCRHSSCLYLTSILCHSLDGTVVLHLQGFVFRILRSPLERVRLSSQNSVPSPLQTEQPLPWKF